MHTNTRNTLRATLAALALAITAAQPAVSQQQQARTRNHAMVAQAAEAYGFDAGRMTAAQERAIDDAWERLLPGEDSRTYRLNRTQAMAIAYVALVLQAQPGRGGWDEEGPARPGRPGRGRDDGGAMDAAIQTIYDLAGVIPHSTINGVFLSAPEKERIRRDAPEIQRLALRGSCTPLADEASRLSQATAGSAPADRRVVANLLERMKTAAQSCRDGGAPR